MAENRRKIADHSGKVMGMCITQTVKDPTDVKTCTVNIKLNMVSLIPYSPRREKMDDWNAAYVKHMHITFPVQLENMLFQGRIVSEFAILELTHVVVPLSQRQKEKVERIFQENPDIKPSQVQSTAILHNIRQGKPWEVKKTAS